MHTSLYSPDSITAPEELVARAKEVGLDGVVITEHDFQWGDDELAELARQVDGLVVLSGAEVSTREGHYLVYGLPDLNEAPPGLPLAELLEVVKRYSAAIVAAHPFRWEQDFAAIVAEYGPVFDALELVSKNVTPQTRRKAAKLLSKHAMGTTGSSDSHEVETIGCYYSEFPDPIVSIADFVAALRRGLARPRHLPGAELPAGPVD
jgi:predicted metal-dependent phosphoesterase TrpH